MFVTISAVFPENPIISFNIYRLVLDSNAGIAAGDIDGDVKVDPAVARKGGTYLLLVQ